MACSRLVRGTLLICMANWQLVGDGNRQALKLHRIEVKNLPKG